jgi:uncharacterized small protein (DUF1192 family)
MIAALSPAGSNHDETLSTLRFAESVACIQTKSVANVDEEASTIEKMRQEIARLKKLIADKKAQKAAGGNAEEDNDEEISDLKEALNFQL